MYEDRPRPGDIVFHGEIAPPAERGRAAPHCSALSIVAKRLGGSGCHLVRRYRPRPRPHCVGWGLRSTRKGAQRSFTFRPICPLWPNGRPPQPLLSSCCATGPFAKTVHPYRSLSNVGVLSRGQTVGWIKMPFVSDVGLGP